MEKTRHTRGHYSGGNKQETMGTGKTSLTFLIPITVFFLLLLFFLQHQENKSKLGLSKMHHKQGLKYSKEKKFDLALIEINKALQYNPKSALLYSSRGLVHWQMGNLNEAIEDYSTSIRLHPDGFTYMTRAHIYEKKGEIENAIMDYTNAFEKKPVLKFALPRKQRLCDSPQLSEEKKKTLCQ